MIAMPLASQFLLASSVLIGFAAGTVSTVTYSDSPIWTVGIGVAFADMNITLGETLAFSSFSPHDVVLVHAPNTGTHWDQCGQNGLAAGDITKIWASTDFTGSSITKKHYTPPTCGEFYIACSVGPHCMYGQRIKVNVQNTDGSACASPCSNATCVTSASRVTQTSGLRDVKPIANSRFWGQGPYNALTVNIGDSVVFRTGAGMHDVATLPGAAEFDICNLTGKTMVAAWTYSQTTPTSACSGSSACCAGSTCGVSAPYVTYTFMATTVGDTYFVCSVGNHCSLGQKMRVTVQGPTATTNVSSAATNSNYARQCTVSFLTQLFVIWVLVAMG